MKLAVMQPYLFPYTGYFQLMNAVDRFVIYDDVNFIKKGWINRNNILVNNEKYMFTLPLVKSGQNRLIKDIQIAKSASWENKFLKTIETSYKKAVNFDEAFALVSGIIKFPASIISEYIYNSLSKINKYLDINTEIVESSSVYSNSFLKGQDRITDICRKENASEYYNLAGGVDLYSEDRFRSEGILLKFIKSKKVTYRQFDDTYVESLSIIDVLMFNKKEKVRELLTEYELL